MNDFIDTIARLILDNMRALCGIVCAVVMLVGLRSLAHHLAAAQTVNAVMFNQLTQLQPANVSLATTHAQHWIPLQ